MPAIWDVACLGPSGAALPFFIITNPDQNPTLLFRVIKALEDFISSKRVAVFLFVFFCGTNQGRTEPLPAWSNAAAGRGGLWMVFESRILGLFFCFSGGFPCRVSWRD